MPADQCHDAGVCDPATGACSNPIKADGTACNDGDACTQSDSCQAGVCTGSNPVVCGASDQCHDAGVCDPATGACTDPVKPDGTACTDGNACTTADACEAGVCVPGAQVPPPQEVAGVALDGHANTTLTWTDQGGVAYDVVSSTLTELHTNGTTAATCLSNDVAGSSYVDSQADPAAGDGYYYLVRAQSPCGSGTYGLDSSGTERMVPNACP